MSTPQPLAAYVGTDTAWILTFRGDDNNLLNLDTDVTQIEARFAVDTVTSAWATLIIGAGITKLTQAGDTLGQARMVLTQAQIGAGNLGGNVWQCKTTDAGSGEVRMSIPPSSFAVLDEVDA